MSDPTPFQHPDRIGPYRIVQVIGDGGMGVVYEAEQREPVRRRVAVKMMKVGMDTMEVIGRFEAERQALAVMEHPGSSRGRPERRRVRKTGWVRRHRLRLLAPRTRARADRMPRREP